MRWLNCKLESVVGLKQTGIHLFTSITNLTRCEWTVLIHVFLWCSFFLNTIKMSENKGYDCHIVVGYKTRNNWTSIQPLSTVQKDGLNSSIHPSTSSLLEESLGAGKSSVPVQYRDPGRSHRPSDLFLIMLYNNDKIFTHHISHVISHVCLLIWCYTW